MYENGQGVAVNNIIAYAFYKLAADSKPEAKEARNGLAKKMSGVDIKEAEKLSLELAKSKDIGNSLKIYSL